MAPITKIVSFLRVLRHFEAVIPNMTSFTKTCSTVSHHTLKLAYIGIAHNVSSSMTVSFVCLPDSFLLFIMAH